MDGVKVEYPTYLGPRIIPPRWREKAPWAWLLLLLLLRRLRIASA